MEHSHIIPSQRRRTSSYETTSYETTSRRTRHTLRARLVGAVAALACCLMLPTAAANAADGPAIQAGADGSVPAQSAQGPQVTKVRVLKEGTFLEVHWNEYVDETQAVNVSNFTLTNGGKTITLRPKSNEGVTDTYYFDRDNKEVAATDAKVFQYLDPTMHISSIAYSGTIDPSKPITLKVKGSAIKDAAGVAAQDTTFTNVPVTSFYTKKLVSKNGIIIKSDDGVSDAALDKTRDMVDTELGLPGTGIAAEMVRHGNAVAVYGNHEVPYLLPEQRYAFNKDMYAAEGYGGYPGDGFVSSISEKNVLRTTGDPDPANNTAYTGESVLAHEFAHAIKLGGLDQMPDQTLANTFYRAYAHAKKAGLWAHTYAYQNSDEFFASLAAIWFNVADESGNGEYDGVRGPVDTNEEFKEYDPVTYAAYEKIFPKVSLPAPWDSTPNNWPESMAKTFPPTRDAAAASSPDLAKDEFQVVSDHTEDRGDIYYLERLTSAVGGGELDLSTLWGAANDLDRSLASWNLRKIDDSTYAFASVASDAEPSTRGLTANANGTVSVAGHAYDPADQAQQWRWYRNDASDDPYDGYLVNVKYGKALTTVGTPYNGTTLVVRSIGSGTLAWSLRDNTQSAAKKSNDGLFLTPTAALPDALKPGHGTGAGAGSGTGAGTGSQHGNGSTGAGAVAAGSQKLAATDGEANAVLTVSVALLVLGAGLAVTRRRVIR
ncbi:hypothetical protein [Bifidobacterium leontopitheci]|uniref:Uncharacterized protein n=1 Tax=Bifidobacterium leontopitheci TaxID=2650774 RepID=A0A6I1GVW3_9BIFI|nr:hypothetical protein [Bifidobacterium leontopitheci]KAB7790601.1 hypothetical protein F7D09_0854 [Bifidobacterium leontopitheci]